MNKDKETLYKPFSQVLVLRGVIVLKREYQSPSIVLVTIFNGFISIIISVLGFEGKLGTF